MKIPKTFKSRFKSAFTLTELLMVLAVVSSIGGAALMALSGTVRVAQTTKLEGDVRALNNAINMFRQGGGVFTPAQLANTKSLLDRLKRKGDALSQKTHTSHRAGFVDERLTFVLQSTAEAATGARRAVLVNDSKGARFEIKTSGVAGIREFAFDEALAQVDYGEEARKTATSLATNTRWVWDFSDPTGGPGRRAPVSPAAGAEPGLPDPPTPPPDKLTTPVFSARGGVKPLNNYPLMLTLTSTNPVGTHQIQYSINQGGYTAYQGSFAVDPGQTINAYCSALDPDLFDDSPVGVNAYATTPVKPLPGVLFLATSLTYFNLGGPRIAGSTPISDSSTKGSAFFWNVLAFPKAYQNSNVFRFFWTWDGSDPLTSPTAVPALDFSGGFLSCTVPTRIADWKNGVKSVKLTAAVKAVDTNIAANSGLVTKTFSATVLKMKQPLLTVTGRDAVAAYDTSANDVPEAARIFYTLDGTDPGVNSSGGPVAGTLYPGDAVYLEGATGSQLMVTARVYPPVAYQQFFTASDPAQVSVTLTPDTSVYVAGDFVRKGGNAGKAMRNIVRLSQTGNVDTRFDTGSGAAAESLVRTIQPHIGGLLAAGDFDTINGVGRAAVAKLRADGSVDNSFNADLSAAK